MGRKANIMGRIERTKRKKGKRRKGKKERKRKKRKEKSGLKPKARMKTGACTWCCIERASKIINSEKENYIIGPKGKMVKIEQK